MNTVLLEETSSKPSPDDSTTGDTDRTRLREAAPVSAVDETPIVKLVRNHDRTQASTKARHTEPNAARLPIGVLTNDPTFAKQLRDALDDSEPLVTIDSMDQAVELAATGGCPILVTDLAVTRSAIETLTQRLRGHDPATAIVVSGNRDQGSLFIGLQSSGAVDAFLLKPVTTAATQLVIEAATRRYRSYDASASKRKRTHAKPRREHRLVPAADLDSGETIEAHRPPMVADHAPASAAPAVQRGPFETSARPSWALLAVVALVAIGAIAWAVTQRTDGLDPNAIVAKHLGLAEAAFSAGRLLEARDGAAHHYQTVLAIDPENLSAHRGLDAIAHALSKEAQAHLSERRLPNAVLSLAQLRQLQPSYAELPLLDSQLKLLQESLASMHAPTEETPDAAPSAPKPTPRSTPKPTSSVAHAESQQPLPEESPAPLKTSSAPIDSSVAQARASEPPPRAAAVDPLPSTNPSTASETPAPAMAEIARESSSNASVANSRDELTASLARPPVTAPTPASASTPSPGTPAPPEPESQLPALIKYVPPEYPAMARARGLEGWIVVSMEIAPNGEVLEPRIEDSDKRQVFGRPALSAVREWKYEPDSSRTPGKRSSVRLEFKLQ